MKKKKEGQYAAKTNKQTNKQTDRQTKGVDFFLRTTSGGGGAAARTLARSATVAGDSRSATDAA